MSVWGVIPVYNNADTIEDVVRGTLKYLDRVVVVDDGSTDGRVAEILAGTEATVLTHETNRGKGAALITALEHVRARGGKYMIALDGDGQHLPEDIPRFLDLITDDPVIFIGCRNLDSSDVPESSRFGRRLSNLWVWIETGQSLRDTQSGFRAYPVDAVSELRLRGRGYDFETEVLTRSAWAGIELKEVDIGVRYSKDTARTSSFRPFLDNLRISLMHSRLVGRRLVPWPHRRVVKGKRGETIASLSLLLHPVEFAKRLMRENATPAGLGVAAAAGSFLAVLPLVGLHTVAIIYVTTRLHLNKIMALAIQNLYAPPFMPFACIELGHYMRYGRWWTDFTRETLVAEVHHRLFEWLLGSLVMAPLSAVVAGAVVFMVAGAVAGREGNGGER
jgi:glycosyltransferase involved in cell wall biosynthesis